LTLVLCSKSTETIIIEKAKTILKEWFGENPKDTPDLTRIVNINHFKRLSKLLDDTEGKIVIGGDRDSSELYIAPTFVGTLKIKPVQKYQLYYISCEKLT